MNVYIQKVRQIKEDMYQLYGMICTYDFKVSWLANSDSSFSIQSVDNVFILKTAGNNQFYSEEELKNAVKSEIELQFKSA